MKSIALDAMGGDHGPKVVMPAAKQAILNFSDVELILVGDQEKLNAELEKYQLAQEKRIKIHHASQVVTMDEKPAHALKKKKDSSMRVAINLVKSQTVQACVSAGNTGALMATSKYVLKTISGISRPAICTLLPTMRGHSLMLDLGANVECTPDQLLQFALMGSVLSSSVDGIKKPTIGLLNIGSEAIKGNETIKAASKLISDTELNFHGFIEGDDIYKGTVDVVVTDGFVGNVSLKTGEGLASLFNHVLKQQFKNNWYSKLAAIIALPVLNAVRKILDPGQYNGASLLGLNGIVIKSHGSADINSYFNAIKIAVIEIDKNVPKRISIELDTYFKQVENKSL